MCSPLYHPPRPPGWILISHRMPVSLPPHPALASWRKGAVLQAFCALVLLDFFASTFALYLLDISKSYFRLPV